MREETLKRFHKAQEGTYEVALREIAAGQKRSHWMWFIFPQLAGLGFSEISKYYSLKDLTEAELYLQDPILAGRLVRISKRLLEVKDKEAYEIFGSPDDLKLKSSMTLFSAVRDAPPVFQQILDKFYDGKKDEKTLQLIEEGTK